jgi:hypothetical protein
MERRRRLSSGFDPQLLRAAMALATSVVLALPAVAYAHPSPQPTPGPYFSAPFVVHRNAYTFGQSPTWTRDGGVLSNEHDAAGFEQVYRSRLDGSQRRCLSCGRLPGPSGFAEQRPQSDWTLFCSMGAQPEHYGAPCLGGYGTDLYVMRPNGGSVTRLTTTSDPAGGANYARAGGVPYDNYHAYWSPDGQHVVWTRTEAYPLARGGQRWEMLVADFVAPKRGRPHLAHIRVVGPAYGVYETQAWAPDGSGFLFTAFGTRRSPYQVTPPGWMHLELYYMRLYGRGASPEHPRVTHLTDNDPAYEEQATFTPDMRDVIVMTSRATPATWYETVISAAQWTGFDAPDAGSAGTPMFVADFTDPRFTADLWMVDVATGAVRQLTNFHRVIPEFGWNFDHTRLLWSGNSRSDSHITWIGSFRAVTRVARRVPRPPAAGLFGKPIDVARVSGAIRPLREVGGAVGSASAFRIPLARVAGGDRQTLPSVVVSYVTLLDQQLHDLAVLTASGIERPPL